MRSRRVRGIATLRGIATSLATSRGIGTSRRIRRMASTLRTSVTSGMSWTLAGDKSLVAGRASLMVLHATFDGWDIKMPSFFVDFRFKLLSVCLRQCRGREWAEKEKFSCCALPTARLRKVAALAGAGGSVTATRQRAAAALAESGRGRERERRECD